MKKTKFYARWKLVIPKWMTIIDAITNEWFTGKKSIKGREVILKGVMLNYLLIFLYFISYFVKCNKGWFKFSVGKRLSVLHDFGFKNFTCIKAIVHRNWGSERRKGFGSFAEFIIDTPDQYPCKTQHDEIFQNSLNYQGKCNSDYFILPRVKIWRTVFYLEGWKKEKAFYGANQIVLQ